MTKRLRKRESNIWDPKNRRWEVGATHGASEGRGGRGGREGREWLRSWSAGESDGEENVRQGEGEEQRGIYETEGELK
jgi:hypothetical protein